MGENESDGKRESEGEKQWWEGDWNLKVREREWEWKRQQRKKVEESKDFLVYAMNL